MVERVLATDETLKLIQRLRAKHGPLMFHQSGGCCDGSSPMCYPEGEFRIGGNDVKLGQIGGCSVYMSFRDAGTAFLSKRPKACASSPGAASSPTKRPTRSPPPNSAASAPPGA